MCAAFDGVDVVYVRVDVLRVVGVVHHGDLDGDALLLSLQVDDVVEEVRTVAVHVAHELFQSVLGVEHFRLAQVAFLVGTQVGERDGDSGVQIGQFTHSLGDDVVFVFCSGEDGWVGPELLACAPDFGFSHHFDGIERFSLLVFLLVNLSVAKNLRHHVRRQRVDAAYAHAVESAGDLV